MKHKVFLFAVLMIAMAIPQSVKAYDFYAVASNGDTLYYNITMDSCAEVTQQISFSPFYSTPPSGDLTIPGSVSYQGTSYKVTAIGNDAFRSCSGLTSVSIPESVTTIGSSAFYLCSGLTSVTIPSSVTSIGVGAFGQCLALTTLTIPNTVTMIGNKAFYQCTFLNSVTIPNSVTGIGNSAFSHCSGLSSIIIPSLVTKIGLSAFSECSGLTEIISRANIAPSLGLMSTSTFHHVPSDIPVFIPCGSLSSYSSEWSHFSNFMDSITYFITVTSADTTMGSTSVVMHPTCDSTAIIKATANAGYRFDHWNDGDTNNPRTITLTWHTLLRVTMASVVSAKTEYAPTLPTAIL